MKMKPLTDEEFISQIRWSYNNRRLIGAIVLVAGIIFVGGAVWWTNYRSENILSLLSETDNDPFYLGLYFGLWFGLAFISSVIVAASGVGIMFDYFHRKTKLLLKYYDQQTEE